MFARVPRPMSRLLKMMTGIKRTAFKRSCHVPKDHPSRFEMTVFWKVKGSVPQSTSSKKERKNPMKKMPIIIMRNFFANWGTNSFFKISVFMPSSLKMGVG